MPGLVFLVLVGITACGCRSSSEGVRKAAITVETKEPARGPLRLNVERAGLDLVLTWDVTAPAVLGAQRALLTIDEGANRPSFQLDPTQLRSGTFLYRPSTENVVFKLEVSSTGGAAKESLIYIDSQPREFAEHSDRTDAEVAEAQPPRVPAQPTPPPVPAQPSAASGAARAGGREPGGDIADAQAGDALKAIRLGLQDPRYPFRTIRRLAVLASVPEKTVVALLREQQDVVLSVDYAGDRIARLVRR